MSGENFPFDEQEPKHVERVAMDSWKSVGDGAVLETVGAEPCIVVALFLPGRGAVLGHFSDPKGVYKYPGNDDERQRVSSSFSQMIDQLRDGGHDFSEANVWVGGGAGIDEPDFPDYNELIRENFKYVSEEIAELGVPEERVESYLSGNFESINVAIDGSDGAMTVEVERVRGLYEEDEGRWINR